MKILITGAGGNLGRALVPVLLEQGHVPVLMDFRALESDCETIVGDVRNFADVEKAVRGCDAIVHCAALHGIHLGKWTAEDFWAINATGTFHVYEAAKDAGIKRVVLCSTMGVYGQSSWAPSDSWNIVSEELPLLPSDVYGMSKVLCEEMARYHARSNGTVTVALRLGMFVPESSLERYGFRLLFGGVDDRDVAQAALQSLTYQPEGNFEAFNLMAKVPFGAADLRSLQTEKGRVLESYFPDLTELALTESWSVEALTWGRTIWSIEKAKNLFQFEPKYNFKEFLEAVRRGEANYAPACGRPWWGV